MEWVWYGPCSHDPDGSYVKEFSLDVNKTGLCVSFQSHVWEDTQSDLCKSCLGRKEKEKQACKDSSP